MAFHSRQIPSLRRDMGSRYPEHEDPATEAHGPICSDLDHLAVFAEGVLNSRPLLPVYLDDGEEFQCLTPGHFFLGRPIRAHAEDLPNDPRLHSVRWSTLRKECQQLWKRWHSSYLQSLQSRSKWTKPQENVRPGNVVLLKDETLTKGRWPLARVVKTQPGPDGLVRVATLLVNGKEYTRAIHRLVPLTTAEEATLPLEISALLQQTDSSSRPPEYVQDSQLPGEKKEV